MERRKSKFVLVLAGALMLALFGGLFTGSDSQAEEWGDLLLNKSVESMKKAKVKEVVFPHWFHRIRFKCKACHEDVFEMEKGINGINMSGIINGKWCGRCHDGKVAFAAVECAKCHKYDDPALLAAKAKLEEPHEVEEAEAVVEAAPPVEESAAMEGDDGGDFLEEEEEEEEEEENPFQKSVEIDPDSPIFLDSSGKKAATGDPNKLASRAARIGAGSHAEALELEGLPKDRFGLIDWAEIIRLGKISPRATIGKERKRDKFEDWVILFQTRSDFIEDVLFPHDVHSYWLDCKSCHDRLFKDKEGTNEVYMTEISEGKWCGWCHGKVAFPLDACTRCHVEPKGEEEEETAAAE